MTNISFRTQEHCFESIRMSSVFTSQLERKLSCSCSDYSESQLALFWNVLEKQIWLCISTRMLCPSPFAVIVANAVVFVNHFSYRSLQCGGSVRDLFCGSWFIPSRKVMSLFILHCIVTSKKFYQYQRLSDCNLQPGSASKGFYPDL